MTPSAERKRDVTHLWAAGFTYGEIGRQLDMTRSAVAGLIRRLDLPRRPQLPRVLSNITGRSRKQPVGDPYKPIVDPAKWLVKQPTSIRETINKSPKPIPVPVNPTRSSAVLFLEAGMFNCRYPLWADTTPADERFVCGAPVMLGKSWCQKCRKVVFNEYHPSKRTNPSFETWKAAARPAKLLIVEGFMS